MAATEAFITPQVLRWARERDNVTRETVAQKIHVPADRLEAWETGVLRPTFRQAQDLARRFAIPFGYLFLPEPPPDRPPLPDLRTVANEPAGRPSAELTALLHDVLEKQQWYREFQEEEGAAPVPFVGAFTLESDPNTVAADIGRTIGVSDLRRRAKDVDEYLRLLVAQAEAAEVLVLRSSIVGNNAHRKLRVQEFRGFAVSDELAPLVFINGQDAKVAQIFTLVHELAHLWLGQSGISNPDLGPSPTDALETERFCNRVAAIVLLPTDEFRARWSAGRSIEANIEALSAAFKVSRPAVLRRAFDLGLISRESYRAAYDRLDVGHRPQPRGSEGGNFYNSLYARNSRTLTTALVVAMQEGRVTRRDAARRLNVTVRTLEGVSQHVLGLGAAPVA